MSETSRRKFIAAAGVGGAAAAGLVAGPASAKSSARAAREPVLAVIDDHESDQVRFLVGEREVVVRDRDLATRILNGAGGN